MKPEMFISGPIPGQSLTREPGNSLWEQPPQYVSLQEVVDFYSEKLVSKESIKGIKKACEDGAVITDIAEVMLKAGMMNGKHTIDVAYIAFPIIVELIKTVAEIAGASRIVVDDEDEEPEVDEETFIEVMNEAKTKVVEAMPNKGLMAKGEE